MVTFTKSKKFSDNTQPNSEGTVYTESWQQSQWSAMNCTVNIYL